MKAVRPIVAALAVVAVLAAVVALSRRRAAPVPTPAPGETPAPTPIPGKLVLFFPGDDARLHREGREVPELPEGSPSRIRLVVEELVAGSREGYAPAFPWTAEVQAVFVDRDGNAYVDLSTPPPDAVAGTDGEVAVVYGTVNSVVANCPGVRRVQVLLGGQQVATLGHLDLSRPLLPNPALVAQ
jgi:hypothetical protein|nr:GerMN domain-containing protein [Thermoanaerobaculaceae bacterium]